MGKRIKNEPGSSLSSNATDMDYSSMHYSNGNMDNGNNVISMDLDFTSGTTGNGNKIKSEPMDFETSTNGKDHLNAKRPQDAALIPGAKAANNHKATTPNIPNSRLVTIQWSKPKQVSNL